MHIWTKRTMKAYEKEYDNKGMVWEEGVRLCIVIYVLAHCVVCLITLQDLIITTTI